MAKKSMIVKQQRLENLRLKSIELGKRLPKLVKHYNRCKVCWRTKSYIREFGICRVCFRKFAREWLIMWVKKSSW